MFTITGDSIIEAAQITKPNEKLRDKLIFGLIIHYLPDIFKFFLSGKTLYLLRNQFCKFPGCRCENEFTFSIYM